MNEKEIGEIRRRFKADRNNIGHIRGCYVNEKHEIISLFDESLKLMGAEDAERYLTIFRRTLSGAVGKNMVDISFSTAQVADSEEHRLLMTLKNSALKDEDAVQALFAKIMQSLDLEGQYLILLAADTYDVPFKDANGEQMEDNSAEMYSYMLCSICPVKQTKPALSYSFKENEFRSKASDWVVSAPELGFLFPAFDDRATNLYDAMYYTRDLKENHPEFVQTIFCTEVPMPAAEQKQTFQSVLANSLGDDCSYDVVQMLHERLSEKIELHKENKETEPLTVSRREMRELLSDCGVKDEHLKDFENRFDYEFGDEAEVNPKNLVDAKKFELRTPDIIIKVAPERADLIQTRILGGMKYIVIDATEGVEVNGVNITIRDED